MRRSLLPLASVGLLALAGAPRLLAEDAKPPAVDEKATIQRLVEDLGSDDFRVREAATKELSAMGEKARPALEAAMKSESPAVRFRAEQILRRLAGAAQERALDEGTPAPGGAPGTAGGRSGRWADDYARLREEIERRMRELEETLRQHGGLPGLGFDDPTPFPWPFPHAAPHRELSVKVDGGDTWAELREGPRGVRITFTDKADPSVLTTFAGKTVQDILARRPQLRDWPGAKALLERYEAEKKARAQAPQPGPVPPMPPMPPGGGFSSSWSMSSEGRSISVEMTPGHVKVTVTEKGPDGKEATRTYEGTDLETLKREHPELQGALGGFQIHLGTPMPPPPPPGAGPVPLGPDTGEVPPEEEEVIPPVPPGEPQTGPFGLALGPIDELLREHLGLAQGGGALVVAVRPGSDAAKMGLAVHDVITSVGGAPVARIEDVARAVHQAGAGEVTMQVIRAGKALTLVRPAATPPK